MDPSQAKILVVDDHKQNLLALEALLGPIRCTVVRATSGEEALKHLLIDEFALILLDVRMPGLDGFETAALIKQREKSRHIPIIFVTANSADSRNVFQGYSAGAVDYISLPVDPDILKSKVSVFVELYEKTMQIKRQAEQIRINELREAALNADRLRGEMEKRHAEETMARQWVILRDILSSVSQGQLQLCLTPDEVPAPLSTPVAEVSLEPVGAIRDLRCYAEAACRQVEFPEDRCLDLVTGASEAALNAVVHAAGGQASVSIDPAGIVQVRVVDKGAGIRIEDLPRATLERGYTTSGTLGHGFWIILETVDRVFLSTTPTGTTIVLEQERCRPQPLWLSK